MSTETITVREAARLLGVHENTVRRYVDRGLIPAERLPTGVRRIKRNGLRVVPGYEDEFGHEMTTEEIFNEPGKFETGREAMKAAPKLFDSEEEADEFIRWIHGQRKRDF
jgi:excisionase family DNA binding protein